MTKTIVYTDHGFPNADVERAVCEPAGANLVEAKCTTADEVIAAGADADALIVQWAPITADVISSLTRCKAIVRLGIGVDNVDLDAARAAGIPVCNVPDYCIDEVADHALALALSLARQVGSIDARVRSGTWRITPDAPMPAFREMTFATVGFGRIARAALDRARPFGFRLVAHDPMVPDGAFEAAGVEPLSVDDLFTQADIVSLHCPHTPETHHLVDADRLRSMKPTAILINTSRGALIDTVALADALTLGEIASVGLDVFETEPLEAEHPLRSAPNATMTSHVSWFSDQSVPLLRRKGAEAAVCAVTGQPLLNIVNA